jgi:hypothetical protein
LVVDPEAVRSGAISLQSLQTIARRRAEIGQHDSGIHIIAASKSDSGDDGKPFVLSGLAQFLSIAAHERDNRHTIMYDVSRKAARKLEEPWSSDHKNPPKA